MAVVPNLVSSRLSYSGTAPRSLCRQSNRLAFLAALVALALTGGGCSFSYQLGSLFEKSDDAAADRTGSIPEKLGHVPVKETASERDLLYARAAASEVLKRGAKGGSQPWENPETGARGTVTPIASAYSQDGFTCQDFLASYVREENEGWMRGEACRIHQGKWEVRSLKPWKSS